MTRARIGIRRAYEPPGGDDGQRVLVDRLWPRGVSKAVLALAVYLRARLAQRHPRVLEGPRA